MNQQYIKHSKYIHDSYNDRNTTLSNYHQSAHQRFQEPFHKNPQPHCVNDVSRNYQCSSYNHQTGGGNRFRQMSIEPQLHDDSNRIDFCKLSYQTGVKNDSQSKSQIYRGNQSTDSPNSGCSQNHNDQRDIASGNFPVNDGNLKSNCLSRSTFSNIMLYLGNNPKSKIPMLKKSFAESPHGCLDALTQKFGNMVKASLSCRGQHLAEGTAKTAKEATIIAACGLFERLQATNYTIVENSYYFTKSRVPNCALEVDPALKHIYRVVYLEHAFGLKFPFPVSGAVDYVQTEDDLWNFIENHCRNNNTIDLFILNIEKSQRKKIAEICKFHNMAYEPINGCSDRGAIVRAMLDLSSLFRELKECVGRNLKYRLIPPGHAIANEFGIIPITEGSENESAKTDSRNDDDAGRSLCKQDVYEDGKEIVVPQWIADNLIIMDYFKNKNSTKETAKEILFCSVKDCKAFGEFIIEKTRDKLSGRITGSALIDRRIVGGGTAFTEDTVKELAAENALQNLKKYCYFIEGKQSYFGFDGSIPEFLYWNAPRVSNTIYKIIDPLEVSSDQDLRQAIRRFSSSRLQDLFLLENISDKVRKLASLIARELNLQVRFFEGGLCIYKQQRPKEVLKELLSLENWQNDKYKLHYPVNYEESKKNSEANKEDDNYQNSSMQNLFDFKTEHSGHVPVNYREKQYNRSEECLQNNQTIEKESDDYYLPTKSKQHLMARSNYRKYPDYNKKPRINE